jgi:choline dehydrogenase-like flavoprotein
LAAACRQRIFLPYETKVFPRVSTALPAPSYDTIIIGSGFGGTMVAHELVNAGERVLLVERGDWVPRGPENWEAEGIGLRGPHYSRDTPYDVLTDYGRSEAGSFACVGGQSVFYGGASLRMREGDFTRDPEIVGDSDAEWPYDYAALEPYYSRAERLLRVAGVAGQDPTEGFRSADYVQPPGELASISRRIDGAARRLGLHPFPLPLAIAQPTADGAGCVRCRTCDGYACAVHAKNDLATRVLPDLLAQGLRVAVNTLAVRLVPRGRRISAVECVRRDTGERTRLAARRYVLSGGALASPHLLLASGLDRLSPGGGVIGRYLMRHNNAVVLGIFRQRPNPERVFDKQLAIHDFYFGHPTIRTPVGKLGGLQQFTPPQDLVRVHLGGALGAISALPVPFMTGLLCIAEDQPRFENHVALDPFVRDRYGVPRLRVRHQYSRRDAAARAALIRKSREILLEAGAMFTAVRKIDTFTHAAGTVRMGVDPARSALDGHCQFRGIENLWVVDGSFMPRSGAVNPSLTIAANALRVGEHLARERRSTASEMRPAQPRRALPAYR